MFNLLNGLDVRDAILIHVHKAVEKSTLAFFWGNLTESIQSMTKGAVTVDSGRRTGVGTFKASKDFARGDAMGGSLPCVSVGCEVLLGLLVWCLIPAKVPVVSGLKATSKGS